MLLTELKVLIIVDGLTMKVASNHNSLVVRYTIHKMNRLLYAPSTLVKEAVTLEIL